MLIFSGVFRTFSANAKLIIRMCLIAFAYKCHPDYDLILAANRDEFFERPTRKAQFWDEEGHPEILAGKDKKGGGTWMGVTTSGRISALTNYRSPEDMTSDGPTRGELVLNFLKRDEHPQHYLDQLRHTAGEYSGFNLLVGRPRSLYYMSNKTLNIERIKPGIHGLSNHLLDTPWPKVDKAKSRLERITNQPKFTVDELFDMLTDGDAAPEPLLPDTGVGVEMEKKLSSMFITMEQYGTRCSTVLMVDREGGVTFAERYYKPGTTDPKEKQEFTFEIEK